MTWLLWLIVLVIVGAILNLPWLVISCGTLAALITVALLWNRYSTQSIVYRRKWHYRRGFPNETTTARIEIENRKRLPLSWLRVTDPWPMPVAPEEQDALAYSGVHNEGLLVSLLSLRAHEKVVRTYKILFRERGIYQIGPASVESGDFFGLFTNQADQASVDNLTVFPELLPLDDIKVVTDDPFGTKKAQRRLFEDPNLPMGIRAYQPDDEFRKIHWPATARTGQLQVKVYQPVSSQVTVFCLNVRTSLHPWIGTYPELLERLIRVCATLVYHAAENGHSVGLLSNGCLAHADQPFRILPGRSPNQVGMLLQALAAVTPYNTGEFEPFLIQSMKHIPFGATLIILTGIVTPELAKTLLQLKPYRPRIVLYSLDPEPPPYLAGIQVIHLPFQPTSADTDIR